MNPARPSTAESPRPKKRKRGRRKPKSLYERTGPKYFGQGMTITYNDLCDVAAALNDKDRVISQEVKAVAPTDIFDALEKVPTGDQQLTICRILMKMHSSNLEGLEAMRAAIRQEEESVA